VVDLQNLVQHVFKMSFYFQFHETSLMLPPQTFCHISLSSHWICKIFHPYVSRLSQKHIHTIHFEVLKNLVV